MTHLTDHNQLLLHYFSLFLLRKLRTIDLIIIENNNNKYRKKMNGKNAFLKIKNKYNLQLFFRHHLHSAHCVYVCLCDPLYECNAVQFISKWTSQIKLKQKKKLSWKFCYIYCPKAIQPIHRWNERKTYLSNMELWSSLSMQ